MASAAQSAAVAHTKVVAAARAERDAALSERGAACAERDTALSERDAALSELAEERAAV